MIWNLTKRDNQTKSEIYTVLQQVGESLGKEFSDFIMERIIEYDLLSNKDLEFMYSFKNKSNFQTELTWKILNNSDDYPDHVVSTAYERIIDNVRFATMEKKLCIIRNCIEKIKNHKASLIFIKILKAVINCSNISTAKLQNLTDQFEQARQEWEEYFFSDFEYYCDKVKKCIAEDSSRSYNAGSESFVDKFTHSIHINERLSCIVDFFKFFKSKISKDQVKILWKIMTIESPCKVNYELFFKWMNEQVRNIDSKQYSVLTNELLEFFYKDNLISKQNSYIHLETEGFRLIKTLFMIINEKEHKMQILEQSQVKKDHGTNSSTTGVTLSSSSYSSDQNTKTFLIYCHPKDLSGIDTFWKIIMECADVGVLAECNMLIINLHQNISNLIEQKRMLIEDDLVKNCISKINELREICRNCSSDDPTIDKNMAKLYYLKKEFTIKQIERICLLIRIFMENSEVHGIGDILTQSTIMFDSKLTVLVLNKISYGQGCYNRKKNPKIFKFNVNGNFTLWKLKELVANKLEIDPILIKAEKAGIVSKIFKDSENHKKLCEIGVENNNILNISSKLSSSMITKLNLVFSDQTLTPEAEHLFNEIFYKFANEDGFMTREICVEFLKSCTSQMTDGNDQRIKILFDNYDRDNDDLITVEDFKDFYRDSIIKKESTVWANIRSWDYRSDLQKGSERDQRAAKTLLRFLLPRKRILYDYFLQMLEDEYMIAKCSWELITRLALDPNLLYKLYDFKDFNETGQEIEFKFENLVDINSPFQLQ